MLGIKFPHVWLLRQFERLPFPGREAVAQSEGQSPERIIYLHTDAQGRVIATSNQAGEITYNAAAEPFGKPTNGNPGPTNLGFPGQYYDKETGLYYNNRRNYNPSTGRFLEPDPMLKASISRTKDSPSTREVGNATNEPHYAYVDNNAIRWIDPWGLARCTYAIATHSMVCFPNDPNIQGPPVVVGPNGVFSGIGECRDNPLCSENRDKGPIPPGNYRMNADARRGHEQFWRLEPDPKIAGWKCALGLERCGFEFHPGSVSLGCITADKYDPAVMQMYDKVHELLRRESPDNSLKVKP